MYTVQKNKLYALQVILSMLLFNMLCDADAAEVKTFEVTDIEGYVGLRYRYDGDVTQQVASSETKESRANFEEEVHVQSQGYFYHPNFLKLDLGAGILFNQESLETTAGDVEHDETLYDFNAQLLLLEKKPYPLAVYYSKSHPSVALNLTDVYVQENEKYGMNFSLRKPVTPVTLNFETYRESHKGDSFSQVTDEQNTYQSVRANYSMINGSYAQLSYTSNDQESLSGSKSLPINPFNVTTETTDFNSRFIFGEQKNIKLNVNVSDTEHKQDRELKEFRFMPNLSWEHSKKLNSYYRYSLTDREQTNIESRNSYGETGFRYLWNENLYANAEIHYDDENVTGLELNNTGTSGSITYKHNLDVGSIHFNMGVNYDQYDRVVSGVVQVSDAPYTFSGSASVTLFHDYIDITTIVVRRADTNEVLTAGLANDYIIIVVGNQTQIQKVNPLLPLNLDVLVSYEYDPGGTAAYNSSGQSYQLSFNYHQYFTIYANYRDTQQDLQSGMPTLPLESSDTTTYGVRMDYPLPINTPLTIGGELVSEKHTEDLSSYQKNSSDLFVQVALPLSSDLHISARRLKVDNLYSLEDVDLQRYALRLRSNPARRLTLSLQLSDEKDTGGSLERRSKNMTFTGQWRIRKLLVELGAKRVFETQGDIKHDRTILNATLRRDF